MKCKHSLGWRGARYSHYQHEEAFKAGRSCKVLCEPEAMNESSGQHIGKTEVRNGCLDKKKERIRKRITHYYHLTCLVELDSLDFFSSLIY